MIEQRYFRVNQAATYLGITAKELRKYARMNLIPYSRPGGKLMLFDKADLDHFIAKHRGA